MLNKAYSSFSEMSTRLVAVSTDSQYSHLAWVDAPPNAGGLGSCQVPLISDHERVLCQLFDVLNGPDIVPAVALIDKQGVIYAVTLTEGQPLTPAILLEWIRLSVSQRSQHGPAPTSPVLGNLGGHQGSPPLRPLATDIKLGTHRMTSLDLNSPSRQRIHTPDSTTRSHSMVSNSLSSRWGAHSDRATEERLPELLQQVSVHSQGLLLEAFQLVDKQNENMVSKDEAVAFYNTFKESTTLPSMRIRILTKLAEQMVNQFDARADADGKILFDDFAHFLLNPDNDNDMHLTAEEEGMFADIEQQITSTEATRKLKDADYLET